MIPALIGSACIAGAVVSAMWGAGYYYSYKMVEESIEELKEEKAEKKNNVE